MAKKIGSADAKAHFAELVSRVEYRGERVIIERRGKPVAALVSVEDLQSLRSPQEGQPEAVPQQPLALEGIWAEVGDEEIDAMVEHIYATRERDLGRPVSIED